MAKSELNLKLDNVRNGCKKIFIENLFPPSPLLSTLGSSVSQQPIHESNFGIHYGSR